MLLLPNYSALGTIVTPESFANGTWADQLTDAGWEELGSGLYCRTFLSPHGDRVVKVGGGCGNRVTIEAALANPDNPHLPTVYGILELGAKSWGDEAFAFETEVLEHLEDYDDDECYSDTHEEWAADWSPYRADFDALPDCAMTDALRTLQRFKGDQGWDAHAGNIMVRPSDGLIVLNDLIC